MALSDWIRDVGRTIRNVGRYGLNTKAWQSDPEAVASLQHAVGTAAKAAVIGAGLYLGAPYLAAGARAFAPAAGQALRAVGTQFATSLLSQALSGRSPQPPPPPSSQETSGTGPVDMEQYLNELARRQFYSQVQNMPSRFLYRGAFGG